MVEATRGSASGTCATVMTADNPYSYDGTAEPTRLNDDGPVDLIYWIPDETVTNHDGSEIPRNMLFPYGPPPEIGQVLTAHSIYGRSFFLETLALLTIIGVITIVGFQYMFWMQFLVLLTYLLRWFRALPLLGFLLQFFGSDLRFRFPLIGYVGAEGVAVWQNHGVLRRTPRLTMYLFKDVAYLRDNHCYDRQGKVLFPACDMPPPPENDRPKTSFELSIGAAWTDHVLSKWTATSSARPRELILSKHCKLSLDSNGEIKFEGLVITSKDILKLAHTYDGHLMFYLHERILDHEARRSDHGRHKFRLDGIQDCRAVLILLPTILGEPLQGKKLAPLSRFRRN
jgi:hypothetical protein